MSNKHSKPTTYSGRVIAATVAIVAVVALAVTWALVSGTAQARPESCVMMDQGIAPLGIMFAQPDVQTDTAGAVARVAGEIRESCAEHVWAADAIEGKPGENPFGTVNGYTGEIEGARLPMAGQPNAELNRSDETTTSTSTRETEADTNESGTSGESQYEYGCEQGYIPADEC